MITAKCTRCGATATGDSFDDARVKMDHAPGLSRGIPCGDNYNCVEKVIEKTESPSDASLATKTDSASYTKVTGKSAEKIKSDESKTKSLKSKSVKE
jgi:hypothetical protein